MAAAESEDGVRAAYCPEHAGLFAAGTNDGLAAGFDDTGADEQVLPTEFRVSHALGIFFKIVGLGADLFEQLRI